MLVGIIFIAHPQLEPQNARLHVLIGSSLILGAHLITADKIAGRPNHRTVLAGVCFGMPISIPGFFDRKTTTLWNSPLVPSIFDPKVKRFLGKLGGCAIALSAFTEVSESSGHVGTQVPLTTL